MAADAAYWAPSRASIMPDVLKRALAARAGYVAWGPFEKATMASVGEAPGVASNSAVNVPVLAGNDVFTNPPRIPATQVASPASGGGPAEVASGGFGRSTPPSAGIVPPVPPVA